jgi:ribosomal RNA-processing protein 7
VLWRFLDLFPKMSGPFSGFTPLPLAYSSDATHYIYIREHAGKKTKRNIVAPLPANIVAGEDDASPVVLPQGRTLFLVNVPPDATERELSLLFKPAGTVERIVFPDDDEQDGDPLAGMSSDVDSDSDMEDQVVQEDAMEVDVRPKKRRKKDDISRSRPPPTVPLPTDNLRTYRRSGRTAHVIFLDDSSLKRALSPPFCPSFSTSPSSSKPHRWPPVDASAPPRGLAHYIAQYAAARPPFETVRAHADAFMARFDHAKAQERKQSKYRKGEAIVDEDGFTLVTRGGAYGQTVGGGVGVASRQFQDTVAKRGVGAVQGSGAEGRRGKGRKKREGKEKEKFYKFQVHEERRNSKAFGSTTHMCTDRFQP